jgi:hypothetical protein
LIKISALAWGGGLWVVITALMAIRPGVLAVPHGTA